MAQRRMIPVAVAILGAILILGAFVNLQLLLEQREQYRFYTDSDTTRQFTYTASFAPDHKYDVTVSMRDSYTTVFDRHVALVEGHVAIYIDGISVYDKEMYDRVSDDKDTPGNDALAKAAYEFTPTSSVNLTIVGTISSGDDWTLEIFRDLPDIIGEQGLIFVGFFAAGLLVVAVGCILYSKK